MDRVVALSLRYRALVFIFVGLAVAGALLCMLTLPVEAVPDISPKEVLVSIVAPGLAPEEVERQVTFPIESQMTGLPGMTDLRSVSRFGVSVVYVEFNDSTDIFQDRVLVNERMQAARSSINVPGVNPVLGPLSTGLGEIMQFQLSGPPGMSLMQLNTIMTWQVAPRIKQIDGVADLNVNGGSEQTFEVSLDERRLLQYGVSPGEVFRAVDENNATAGGAWIEHNQEQQVVIGRGLIQTLDDLGNIVLRGGNGANAPPVFIRNVADVRMGPRVRLGAVTRDGKGEIVNAVVLMQVGRNSGDVTRAVRASIPSIEQSLPKGVTLRPFYDRSDLSRRTIHTVEENLTLGAVLVMVTLLVMIGDVRAALVITSVIPLSLLIALTGMKVFGISANLMSLGAIDFGMIVDGSLVLVENTLRRQSAGYASSKSAGDMTQTVGDAARDVARPITFAVAIIIIVYLPVLSLQSIEGKMFRPMAETVILGLLGSLLLCLTWIPAIASLALRSDRRDRDTAPVRWARAGYTKALAVCENHPWIVLSVAAILFGTAAILATRLGGEFIPQLQEGSLVVTSARLPSVALPTSIANATLIEKTLKSFPDVKTVISNTGTSAIPTDPMGVEQTDSFVILKPSGEWKTADGQDGLVAAYGKALEKAVPGTAFTWSQPIEMRMDDLLEGVKTAVAISIYGDDLATLARLGKEVAQVVRSVQGAADTAPEQISDLPFMQIDVDRRRAAQYGVNARDVLDVVAAIGGRIGGNVFQNNSTLPTQVRFNAVDRDGIDRISALRVLIPAGGSVPLSEVATIKVAGSAAQVSRDQVQRRTVVQTNVRGRDTVSFVKAAQAAVAQQVKLPPGYRIEWAGQFQNLAQASHRLAIVVPVALILIFVMLYMTFGSVRLGLLIFLNLPMAATGGIFALVLRGLTFSVSAGIGFIALFGVAVLNGVVMVSYIVARREDGGSAKDAATEAAQERFRPVLATALVASFGFIPMAFSTSAGAEVERPLATVVIGGLISSTLLTLLLLPSLYPRIIQMHPLRWISHRVRATASTR